MTFGDGLSVPMPTKLVSPPYLVKHAVLKYVVHRCEY